MSDATLTDWIQAISSALTMLAALTALRIAAKAPHAAAQFAEQFRRESAAADQKQQLRMHVLLNLVKCRNEIMHHDARAAINMVDVAFEDVPGVVDARRLFIEASKRQPFDAVLMIERYHALIICVARAMGVSETLSGQDFRDGYYPEALGKIDEAAIIDAEEKIARARAAALLK
jgi:hypothetical protein